MAHSALGLRTRSGSNVGLKKIARTSLSSRTKPACTVNVKYIDGGTVAEGQHVFIGNQTMFYLSYVSNWALHHYSMST